MDSSNELKTHNFRLVILLYTTVCFWGCSLSNANAQTGYLYSVCDSTIEKCGYADENGKIIIPIGKYLTCYTDTIQTIGFVFSREERQIIAIDKSDKKLFTVLLFDNGPDYVEDGLFRIVDDSTGLIGFADMNGKIIIPPHFFEVRPFSEGFAAFNEDGKFEELDEEHTIITGGKWGYIDKTGKEVFPAIFDKASSFEEGKAEVQIGEYVFYLFHEE